jgi:hypothetical protein
MKTIEEIEALKRDWKNDPVWDIETTEGFEDHTNDLLAFRKECESRWAGERYDRLSKKADNLGVPGNINLAAYVVGLEGQIEALEYRMRKIEEKI